MITQKFKTASSVSSDFHPLNYGQALPNSLPSEGGFFQNIGLEQFTILHSCYDYLQLIMVFLTGYIQRMSVYIQVPCGCAIHNTGELDTQHS